MDKFQQIMEALARIESRLATLEKQDMPLEVIEWAPTVGESYHQGYARVKYMGAEIAYLLKAAKDGGSFWTPLTTKPRKESSEWLKGAAFDSRSIEERVIKMLHAIKNEYPSGYHKDRSGYVFRTGPTPTQAPQKSPNQQPEKPIEFDFSNPPDFPPSTNEVPF